MSSKYYLQDTTFLCMCGKLLFLQFQYIIVIKINIKTYFQHSVHEINSVNNFHLFGNIFYHLLQNIKIIKLYCFFDSEY